MYKYTVLHSENRVLFCAINVIRKKDIKKPRCGKLHDFKYFTFGER
jgi:hypothetical protein